MKWCPSADGPKIRPSHRQHGDRRQEWKAQLDYIIGSRWKSDEAYTNNDVKIWDSCAHHPVCARIQEDEIAKLFPARKRNEKWPACRPTTDVQ